MSLNEYLWSLFLQVDSIGNERNPFTKSFGEFCQVLNEIHETMSEIKNPEETENYNTCNTSLYINAFLSGVEAVLDDIYDVAVDLEEDFLDNSDLSVMHIETKINPLRPLLHAIKSCITEIRKIDFKGCLIFDCLEKYTSCGDESIENYFKIIQEHCLRPFFLQMVGWLVKGEINDPYEEFFIQPMEKNSETNLVRISNYIIDYKRLPECVPDTFSEKVLFIGECIIFCRDKGKNEEDTKKLEECLHCERVVTYFQNFDKKQNLVFFRLENCIEEIWTSLNQNLYKLLVTQGSFTDLLKQISDIFFIGRGELFQEFLSEIKYIYDRDVGEWTNLDLESKWEQSVFNVYHIDDPCKLLDIKIQTDLKERVPVKDVLQIRFETSWICQLLIIDSLDVFNRTFRFLLKLKRAHMDLHSVWIHINHLHDHKTRFLAIEVRNKLLAFIGSVQSYWYLIIIQPNLFDLIKSMETAVSFHEVQNLLKNFLKVLIDKLFITDEQIMKSIINIFTYCETLPKILIKPELLYTRLDMFKIRLTETFRNTFDHLEKIVKTFEGKDLDLLLYLKRSDYC